MGYPQSSSKSWTAIEVLKPMVTMGHDSPHNAEKTKIRLKFVVSSCFTKFLRDFFHKNLAPDLVLQV